MTIHIIFEKIWTKIINNHPSYFRIFRSLFRHRIIGMFVSRAYNIMSREISTGDCTNMLGLVDIIGLFLIDLNGSFQTLCTGENCGRESEHGFLKV